MNLREEGTFMFFSTLMIEVSHLPKGFRNFSLPAKIDLWSTIFNNNKSYFQFEDQTESGLIGARGSARKRC